MAPAGSDVDDPDFKDWDEAGYAPAKKKPKPPSKKGKNGGKSKSKKSNGPSAAYVPAGGGYTPAPTYAPVASTSTPLYDPLAGLPTPLGPSSVPGSTLSPSLAPLPVASTSAQPPPRQRVEGQIVSVRMADGKVFELDIHEAALAHAVTLDGLDAERPAKRQRTDDGGEEQKPNVARTAQDVLAEIITEAASRAQPVDPIQHAHEKRLEVVSGHQPVHEAVLGAVDKGESIPDSLKNLLPNGPPSTVSGPFVIPPGVRDKLAIDPALYSPSLSGPVDKSAVPADASLAVYYVVYERTVTVQPQQLYDVSSGTYIPIQGFTSVDGLTSSLPPHVYAVANLPESVRGPWRNQNGKGKDRPTLAEVRDGKEAPWPKDIDLSKRQRAPRRCQICQSFECKGRGGRKFCPHYDPETDGLKAGTILPPPEPYPMRPSPSPAPIVQPLPTPPPVAAPPLPPPMPTAEETAQAQEIQAILDQQEATGEFALDVEAVGDLEGYGEDLDEEEEGGVLQMTDL